MLYGFPGAVRCPRLLNSPQRLFLCTCSLSTHDPLTAASTVSGIPGSCSFPPQASARAPRTPQKLRLHERRIAPARIQRDVAGRHPHTMQDRPTGEHPSSCVPTSASLQPQQYNHQLGYSRISARLLERCSIDMRQLNASTSTVANDLVKFLVSATSSWENRRDDPETLPP